MATGIRSRVPAAEYHSLPGISITRLKEMRRSPLHYLYRLDHPKDTEPMRLGTAAHTAVLEPERFDREYAIWGRRTESGVLRPRRGKDWQDFASAHHQRTIITADEHDLVIAVQAAVRGNQIAARYLTAGDPEVTMQWMLGERECRGRVDWLHHVPYEFGPPDCPVVIVGLKTARDCRHFIFGSAAAKLGYHLQWSWYYDGYKAITGRAPRMVEVVVESAPPHAVAVYTIPGDMLEQGREEYQKLLKRLTECESIGYFPGPEEEEVELTLPSWAYESEDDLSELRLEA